MKNKMVDDTSPNLTLPSGVPIDVAGHEPPSLAVLGSTLGLLEGETRPLGDVVTPLQGGLPLPRLPSTMPSSGSLCRESCRMTCPKNDSFLFFTVSNSDLLVSAIRITSSFVMRLVQLIRSMRLKVHVLNASRRCCDLSLMVHVSTQCRNVNQT